MHRLTAFVLGVALLASGALASVSMAASSPSKPATVGVRSTSLGKILVNGKGVTLYLFEKDKNGKSACSGACAVAWPPLLTKGKAKAMTGANAKLMGTTHRSDGTTQVTYKGHPLYLFVGDRNKPGSVAGEGSKAFGAGWYVMRASGAKVDNS